MGCKQRKSRNLSILQLMRLEWVCLRRGWALFCLWLEWRRSFYLTFFRAWFRCQQGNEEGKQE